MKRNVLALAVLAVLSVFTLAFTNAFDTYKVDVKESVLTWKAYKVTGSHAGNVTVKNGTLQFTDGNLTGGTFDIDMAAITVTDITGGSAAKLLGHLKSPDFFSVETHPTAKFNITRVVSRGTPGDYKIIGDITIKEKTKNISFNAKVVEKDGRYEATTQLKLDRTDFDVRYGSGSFFDGLGDKTIYDEFDLDIKLVTTK